MDFRCVPSGVPCVLGSVWDTVCVPKTGQVRMGNPATGNIVTQYNLPHGRVVGV